MMHVRVLGIAVMLAMLPAAAHAESATQIAPPFDRVLSRHGCLRTATGGVQLPGCTSGATVNADGSVAIDVRAQSPLDGRVPGPAGGSAWTGLAVDYDMPEVTARALVYTITLHVEHATATATAGEVGAPGHARAAASAYAYLGELSEETSVELVDSGGVSAPTELHDSVVTLSMLVGDGISRTFSGRASLLLEVEGSAETLSVSTNPPGGTVEMSVVARAISVTVEAIP